MCSAKVLVRGWKHKLEWKKSFANHIFDEGLISRILRNFLNSTVKKYYNKCLLASLILLRYCRSPIPTFSTSIASVAHSLTFKSFILFTFRNLFDLVRRWFLYFKYIGWVILYWHCYNSHQMSYFILTLL